MNAFQALYVKHWRFVRSLVLKYGVAERDADDLAQEVFLDVARGDYDASRPFRPWVQVIAQRKVRDHRSLARHRERLTSRPSLDVQIAGSPEDSLAIEEATLLLRRALAMLPENMRVVLLLADVEEVSQAEIQTRLSLSEPMVQSLLRRSRRDLGRLVRLADRGIALSCTCPCT